MKRREPNPQRIEPKVAIPWLKNAGLEEREDLQILWANLLQTMLSSSVDDPSFVNILADLSSADVKVFDYIASEDLKAKFHGEEKAVLNVDDMSGRVPIAISQCLAVCDKLYSKGLLIPRVGLVSNSSPTWIISNYGILFYKAVSNLDA